MALPPEITDILSQFGLPAGAIVLAVGVVRGAQALENDASEAAIKYISDLLKGGDLQSLGKLGTSLVPALFDRIFGTKPFSLKFISRSILATTVFWLLLLIVKHPDWEAILHALIANRTTYIIIVPTWYFVDWLSLIKACFLLRFITNHKYPFLSTFLFLIIDILCSYALTSFTIVALLLLIILLGFALLFIFKGGISSHNLPVLNILHAGKAILINDIDTFIHFKPIFFYFYMERAVDLVNVMVPSTLLTSAWTFLLMVSSSIALLLIPMDYFRRFTAWWFRDVEKRPLTAIAKVAATLIMIGAVVIKGLHWLGI